MTYDDKIYSSLLPLIIINLVFVIIFMYYAVSFQYRKKTPEALARLHRSFIGSFFSEFWYWFIDPIVRLLAFLKFTPNMVTSMSIVLSLVTGYLFFIGEVAWGGWFVVISGNMDLLDGRLARVTGRSTRSGAFYDACIDRYSDAFVFIGLAFYFLGRNFDASSSSVTIEMIDFYMLVIAILVIVGTEVISYAKARGEAMGFTTSRGLMQRPERIVMLAFFSILHPFFKIIAMERGYHPDITLMGAVVIMAVLVNYSAVVRIASIFKDIKKSET